MSYGMSLGAAEGFQRPVDKVVATDVGDFSEAIKHYFRRQRPAGVIAYAAV